MYLRPLIPATCLLSLAISTIAAGLVQHPLENGRAPNMPGMPDELGFTNSVGSAGPVGSAMEKEQGVDPEFGIFTLDEFPGISLELRAHDAGYGAMQRGRDGMGGKGDVEGSRSNDVTLGDVCPGATSGYTGYLHSGSKHFYFAYFTSRSTPLTDPLVMWINGGPGCSSMTGLLMELGPCRVDEGGKTASRNDHSWIEAANVIFLDQPIGVGWSYSDEAENATEPRGTYAASEDVYAFMRLWYLAFPASRALPFSIAGESYGGHYIPIFAEHIRTMNTLTSTADQIPLESVLIGNGIFAEAVQATSAYDIACTNATGTGILLNATTCAAMEAEVPRCQYLMDACEAFPDPLICDVAVEFCGEALELPYVDSGRNYYDISKPCLGPLCYSEIASITTYLRTPSILHAFGASSHAPKFTACSNKVGRQFAAIHDHMLDTRPQLASLLENGVRVLIYVGTYDWICNFVGNERVFGGLKWSGLPGFRAAQENGRREWSGGKWWESEKGELRYVRVEGAGHMVPFDRGEEALWMFRRWLDRKEL